MEQETNGIKTEVKLPSAEELLEAGVHFGHRTSAWHPKMEPYIFGVRNRVHIFDLQKTLKKLEEAIIFLKGVIGQDGTILFVGTKPAAKSLVKETAQALGMPYVNERWLGGTLTNFKTISKRLEHYRDLERRQEAGDFQKYTKKERLGLQKELDRLEKQFIGIKGLTRLPQALWVSDARQDNLAIREARRVKIPVVAIADTNIDPSLIDYIIPANDDAVSSLKKILGVVLENLLEAKKDLSQTSPVLEE